MSSLIGNKPNQVPTNGDLGSLAFQDSENVSIGLLRFDSGYGKSATAYGCRAWVNFNGTGTVAIRASGNVSSITDGGTGVYTVNFTTAMPDANYSAVVTASDNGATAIRTAKIEDSPAPTSSGFTISTVNTSAADFDVPYIFASVFR